MTTKSWMRELAHHYRRSRANHPEMKLMIMFGIDGTILDTRRMIVFVIQSFDREHGTSFFRRLTVSDVDVHENQVEQLLARWHIPNGLREDSMSW